MKKDTQLSIKELEEKARFLRNRVLDMAVAAGAGHIAPSFSCIEILVALFYGGGVRVDSARPLWEDRDRFILSKGQAAVALYAVLADLNYFPDSQLDLFTQPGSHLGGHTDDLIPGVEAFTGSLGNGFSVAAGVALAAKIDKKDFKTVSLLGDGECHEGAVWETAMFAGARKLGNLMVIVDNNGLSATDYLEQYLDPSPLEDKWKAFGWETMAIDGHSIRGLIDAINLFRKRPLSAKPLAVIAETIKGKGVSFMENKPIWHYRIPVGDELLRARHELSGVKKG